MSRENVEIVRRAVAAFERGDLDQMLALAADDLITYRADPDDATYHGKDGFLEVTAEWTEGFREWSVAPEEFIDAGNCVVVRVHQSATGEGSGVPVEQDFWFVYELRDEKVAKQSFYTREAEALEAAELSA